MPREGHIDYSKITPRAVRKGAQISVAVDGGYATRQAPADGVYFETAENFYFIAATVLEEVLQMLYDDIKRTE